MSGQVEAFIEIPSTFRTGIDDCGSGLFCKTTCCSYVML